MNACRTWGRWLRITAAGWVLPLAGLAAGCGGDTAAVSGKVTAGKGEPVKGGTLVFRPVAAGGEPATAEVGPDGTYTLGTHKPGDGAKPGRYTVGFTPPPQELTEQQRTDPKYKAPPPAYAGLAPKAGEVEVKPGSNTIDVELTPKGR